MCQSVGLELTEGGRTIPGNVGGVKHSQALIVLQVGDAEIALEADGFGVADVGAVEEGAEEEKRQDREDSVLVSGPLLFVLCSSGYHCAYLVSVFQRMRCVNFASA
jgi:hypothetical protein